MTNVVFMGKWNANDARVFATCDSMKFFAVTELKDGVAIVDTMNSFTICSLVHSFVGFMSEDSNFSQEVCTAFNCPETSIKTIQFNHIPLIINMGDTEENVMNAYISAFHKSNNP